MSGFLRWSARAIALFALALAPRAQAEARAHADTGARVLLAEIAQSAHSVRVELSDARRTGDVPRTRCVSRKLTEVHAQMRLADQHATSLASARSKDAARLHRHVLELSRERARELAQQAHSACGESRAVVRVIPPREGHVAAR